MSLGAEQCLCVKRKIKRGSSEDNLSLEITNDNDKSGSGNNKCHHQLLQYLLAVTVA